MARQQPRRSPKRAGRGAKKGPTPRKRPLDKPRAPIHPARAKRQPRQGAEALFFNRLRLHAKWMFVLLAVIFAVGFVGLGIGSGNSGSVLDLFNGGLFSSSGGSSLKSLEKKAAEHPKSSSAWLQLGTAYQSHSQDGKAALALKQAVNLNPKDALALSQLGALYQQRLQAASTKLQSLSTEAQQSSSPLTLSGPLAQSLTDPLQQIVQQELQARATPLQTQYQQASKDVLDTYRLLAIASPSDPSVYLQLASAAANQGQYDAALAAARRFISLAPDDPQVSQVKAYIQRLQQAKAQTQKQTQTQTVKVGANGQTSKVPKAKK